MTEITKEQSSPFSTGEGGANFETRVQGAFVILMLTGRIAPCIKPYPITKIKLQGRYAGFNTDDFIVFSKQPQTGKEAKLLAQIKHTISISTNDDTFAEVIRGAWKDSNDISFDSKTDAIALITGPLNTNDTNNARPILEFARYSENEVEFFSKINNIGSDAKRKKLEAIKTHLKTANGGVDISDKRLWEFLKIFHIIGYDLDTETGSTLSLLQSLISQYSNDNAPLLWARIIDVVQNANQNAGTLTLESLPEDIRSAFNTVASSAWLSDLKKLKDHGSFILEGINTTVGGLHINQSDKFIEMLNLSETSNFIFVTGERGVGKSSLIREFSEYMNDYAPVFYLRTEDLDKPHLDNVFSDMGLSGSLSDFDAGFALMPKKYLVIESFEKLLELENTQAFTDLLHLLNRQQDWTVIATGRDYSYQPIAFQYLQPSGVNFATLKLDGFSDDQINILCDHHESLKKLSRIPTLKRLLKSPFFADLAYRVLESGTEFTSEDGEREFRVAVWQYVIAKEPERTNGMPLRRKETFIKISVKRAKQMIYGVPVTDFDSDAVLKLEEDNLIRRDPKNNLISPAHDVLEDWALEQYIDDAYQQDLDNTQSFLNAIGNEPAMNRAYRLWLHQKLRYGENIQDFILSVINNSSLQRYWQDETIAAILLGENPHEFLELLKDRIFLNDGELLKRFCFVLRIACQAPDNAMASKPNESNEHTLVDSIFLKPYGNGWKAIIYFLFDNKDHLTESLLPHIIAVLNDWSSLFYIDNDLPLPAHEAGLLALYLLDSLKESFRHDKDRKKLLSFILKSISVIHTEFVELLEKDVFISKSERRHSRSRYVDDLCELAFSLFESAFLCKYDPNILIKLANFEWLLDESDREILSRHGRRLDVAECFGLHEDQDIFFPPSGFTGPFRNLLYYHQRKGLDFILNLLNITAEKYAHSDLDYDRGSSGLRIGYSEPLIKQIEIYLNDESSIKQYYSGRLWGAYREHSVIPYLLQSALMALENWLIAYVEHSEPDTIEWLFDYILRNSNSVMPTAVLASVATGFPEKVGRSALALLRTPELYFMDSKRALQELVGNKINWFAAGLRRDTYSEIQIEDRRTAAQRSWRKQHLETLILRLQFSALRDNALSAIDFLRLTATESEKLRFLFHRIDSRGLKPVEDKENNRIIFEPINLEPDLEEIHQKSQKEIQITNRFLSLLSWGQKKLRHETLDKDNYESWFEALNEAKNLSEKLKAGTVTNLSVTYYSSLVIAAAVFIRDHSNDLPKEDISWCKDLIIPTVTENADTDNPLVIADETDLDGAAAASSILPILLDFTSTEAEKLIVKNLIVIALTHANENVRCSAADGVREHLWQRDPKFAQNCIFGALEFARLEKDNQIKRRLSYLEDNSKDALKSKQKAKRIKFRNRFARSQLTNNLLPISLQTHNTWHILTACLMIPDGSKKPEHIALFSQMLTLFFEAEQNKNNKRSRKEENLEISYEISLDFTKRFSKYLFSIQESGFEDYIEQLRAGCNAAPDFINYLVLCFAVETEKTGRKEVYWNLWNGLSKNVQDIAIDLSHQNTDQRQTDNRSKLIRGMLQADIDWQKIDLENQDIAYGKKLILEFAINAGKNPDVFGALAKLMYYFPSIFFESGIHILSKHQKEEGGIRLLSEINTAFYLERSIQRFLQINQTGPLLRNMHESCFILLDALFETASSRAYYLREHLIRSRKIS